ncbi:MarR family transcriptional regulator [Antrihabitans cavernicola]|uniref:MarR family transcriptional regulator n=2 Tax=Antrihabitans cavernicola TaxID=2495913 RepID=A0A5A7SIC3_9NOCA|nr:MarR family transcriptional regulator [Spelaeibacter cavernicola]
MREHSDTRTGDPLVNEWRDLLTKHSNVSCALEKALQDEHGIGVSEFETLDRLIDAGCSEYRMSDLANDIYLSQSALSRTVARLERDKLVDRTMCSTDRRSIFVCLTDAGRALHAQARVTHRAVLANNLG